MTTREQQPTDIDIEGAIRTALLAEPEVPLDRIEVHVTRGIATLSGTVDSQLQREAAIRATLAVSGVHQVVDRLVVAPPAAMADELAATLTHALKQHHALSDCYIDVDVTAGGNVTLLGTVATPAQSQAAEELVSRAKGVTSVSNLLLVIPGYEL